ncbi:hypothetical protein SHIRM173S_02926 [Streptomyces hirsutus]
MPNPTTISVTMATILISENQNSVSPNAFTVGRLRTISRTTAASAGIHSASPPHQYDTYPEIAMMSATPVTIQQNQWSIP